jgi:hypothetical protein
MNNPSVASVEFTDFHVGCFKGWGGDACVAPFFFALKAAGGSPAHLV